MKTNNILEAISANYNKTYTHDNSQFEMSLRFFGLKSCDEEYSIGDSLPASFDLSFYIENYTGKNPELPGTCATGFGYLWLDDEEEDTITINNAIEIQQDYKAKYQYLIAGENYEYGEDKDEIIIESAVVVAVIKN